MMIDENAVDPIDKQVGGDGDHPGIAQSITSDDIQTVFLSDEPIANRLNALQVMRSDIETRMAGDRGAEFGPLLREIDEAIDQLSSAGGENGARAAYNV